MSRSHWLKEQNFLLAGVESATVGTALRGGSQCLCSAPAGPGAPYSHWLFKCICSRVIGHSGHMGTLSFREAGKYRPVKCLEGDLEVPGTEPATAILSLLCHGGLEGGMTASVRGTFEAQELNSEGSGGGAPSEPGFEGLLFF